MKYILELEDEPNKEYFGEGNYYRCKQIPYWSISESMRNRLEPYDEADRKTEPITHDDYIESENDYLEARCLNCNNAKACKEKHWDGCVYEPKYEGNCSEKPNNCEVKNYCDDCLYTDTCDDKAFFYACTSKATISKMEQVDKDINVRSKDCETCKWGEWYRNGRDITNMDDECGGCCSWNSKWTPKTEETEMERLERIDNEIEDAWARIRELTDEPQTDCAWREPCGK